jgi:hypothetical protein
MWFIIIRLDSGNDVFKILVISLAVEYNNFYKLGGDFLV